MRQIIEGVAYDTETATFIAMGQADPDDQVGSQASWSLYRNGHGVFFEVVAGHDGVLEEVNPLSDDQARRFLEMNANHLIEQYFGLMPEAGQTVDIQDQAFVLLKEIEGATRDSAAPVILEQLHDLQMTAGDAKTAFNYLKGKGLIEANFSIHYSARLSASGHDAIKEAQSTPTRSAGSITPASADEPLPDAALAEIRAALADIKAQLPAVVVSNAARAEIDADIVQIEVETNRPNPRRRFMKLYLESLRDNLAKAAGAGTVAALAAAVGGLLAKYFGVL